MRSWRLTVRWIADGLENDDASMRRSVGMRPPPVWKASSQEMLRRDDKQRIQILGSWRVALAAGGRASMTHGKVAQSLERSEEHTSELQSIMRISYAVFCLKKKKK